MLHAESMRIAAGFDCSDGDRVVAQNRSGDVGAALVAIEGVFPGAVHGNGGTVGLDSGYIDAINVIALVYARNDTNESRRPGLVDYTASRPDG